jgi:hypothetical protein
MEFSNKQMESSPGVCWVGARDGSLPEGAILAGHDKDGGPLYIGRAFFESDILPAKVVPKHGVAYVSYSGQEHLVSHYEVEICTALCLEAPQFLTQISNRRLSIPLRLLSRHLQICVGIFYSEYS